MHKQREHTTQPALEEPNPPHPPHEVIETIDSILDDIDALLAQEDEFLTTYRQKGGQ